MLNQPQKHQATPDETKEHAKRSVNQGACYCACSTGGPCEHRFGGWVEFEDGSGGSQVCSSCGISAMSHSLRTAP